MRRRAVVTIFRDTFVVRVVFSPHRKHAWPVLGSNDVSFVVVFGPFRHRWVRPPAIRRPTRAYRGIPRNRDTDQCSLGLALGAPAQLPDRPGQCCRRSCVQSGFYTRIGETAGDGHFAPHTVYFTPGVMIGGG